MLAGHAWAVVAGFLATRPSSRQVWLGLLIWAAARAAVAAGLSPGLAALPGLAFAAWLFRFAGMPFLRSARSAHNLVFAPLIGLFAAARSEEHTSELHSLMR